MKTAKEIQQAIDGYNNYKILFDTAVPANDIEETIVEEKKKHIEQCLVFLGTALDMAKERDVFYGLLSRVSEWGNENGLNKKLHDDIETALQKYEEL